LYSHWFFRANSRLYNALSLSDSLYEKQGRKVLVRLTFILIDWGNILCINKIAEAQVPEDLSRVSQVEVVGRHLAVPLAIVAGLHVLWAVEIIEVVQVLVVVEDHLRGVLVVEVQ
jgi:hypothetical protein